MRPSTGLTSRFGVVPISTSQDTTGPLGKSVWDVAVTLGIMAGEDKNDPYTKPANAYRPDNYTQFLGPDGFAGLRIGIPREPFFANESTRDAMTNKAFEEAVEKIKQLGATVLEAPLPYPQDWNYTFTGFAKRINDGIIMTRESNSPPLLGPKPGLPYSLPRC